jgi:hypothetical protein
MASPQQNQGIDPSAAIGWSSLKHGGLLIAPSRLGAIADTTPPGMSAWLVERLRRDVTNLLDARTDADRRQRTGHLLETVFERVLGLIAGCWVAGPAVGQEFHRQSATGDTVRPHRVWQSAVGGELCVFLVDAAKGRLGVGNSRRDLARVTEWLRRSLRSVALVTNGRQWRLVHAGADYEAFCEWDIELWFEEGCPSKQVTALRQLLCEAALTPRKGGQPSPLLGAIADSRKGQNDLSSALGERVRQAVERLISASARSLDRLDASGVRHVERADLYRAAVRMVMRCVVVLFAEARDLLPRSDPAYHDFYGMQGLRESLDRQAGSRARDRLRNAHQAWPRLVALMRLVYHGSAHQWMPVAEYGSELFRPGDPASPDAILRAVAAFEDTTDGPSDADVHHLLELLCLTKVKVRQGKGAVLATVPVDFSDLSSEYIGILYEGLLDFELRRADDLTLFLGVGNQPALPFTRLDEMSEAQLKDLFGKLKKADKEKAGEGEGDDETEADADDEEAEGEEDTPEVEEVEEVAEPTAEVVDDKQRDLMLVREWARKAVLAAGMAKPLKLKQNARFGENERLEREYQERISAATRQLVVRVVYPGDWYLVRWGGTRKGAGTFYTRPQLAGPTVRRTLQPLAYDPVQTDLDEATGLEHVNGWKPRTPEQILALKVCDPAMGSGSFLVSALRYLTEALWESLYAHGRLDSDAERTVARLGDGLPADHPSQQTIPLPKDHPDFDARLKAVLRRHVVERCLYGVDLDPLAVELGKLALWVETMDPRLPFGFLDHKLRCGNALVGCWFDRFRAYPYGAWQREGGDKGHTTSVHFAKEAWTKTIAQKRKALAKQSVRQVPIFGNRTTPEQVHDQARSTLAGLHELPVFEQEERAERFKALQTDPDFAQLQLAFDTWCALWFWPVDHMDLAPTPGDFMAPSAESAAIVRRLRDKWRFLHWELAFPDVFDKAGAGFDAVVGNPPWEIQKPNSKEFFSNIDPLYRTYGKQEALAYQKRYFEADSAHELSWLRYNGGLKSLGNWVGSVGAAEAKGAGYADPAHPFRHQGSADVNTYKLFLEQAHALLRVGGSLGFIVPSGVYSDKGTTDLRALFLDKCQWLWLFGFENRDKIFDIHRSFKFCPLIVQKGGQTRALRAAFMRHSLDDWAAAEAHVLAYPRERVLQFSPKSLALLEIMDRGDLALLLRVESVAHPFLEHIGKGVLTEVHKTNDSKLFLPASRAGEIWPDHAPRWLDGDGRVALAAGEAHPVIEGKNIHQFNPAWSIPQILMTGESVTRWHSGKAKNSEGTSAQQFYRPRVVFREVARSTDERSMIATYLPRCSLTTYTLRVIDICGPCPWPLLAFLNSFVLDHFVRLRGNLHLSTCYDDLPIVRTCFWSNADALAAKVAALCLAHSVFAGEWLALPRVERVQTQQGWRRQWAITPHERLRLRCILDAAVAHLYGLALDDFAWILRDCDHPVAAVTSKTFARTLDPKGFWRVDKHADPELRHTVLSLVAFHDLERVGLDAFLSQNDGEGWRLPESLRLSDYDLGRDDRAQAPQPVASRLGPHFLDWQLNEDVAASWDECRRHAEVIDQILAVGKTEEGPQSTGKPSAGAGQVPAVARAPAQIDLFGEPLQVDLFGHPLVRKGRR